jgi:hypothetical protein
MIALLFAIVCLFFTSCVSQRKMMDSWVNHPKTELIEKWGPPARTASNGSNGEILIYSHTYYIYGTATYRYNMFYTTADGNIYHWLVQSGQVPPQQMDVNLYVH